MTISGAGIPTVITEAAQLRPHQSLVGYIGQSPKNLKVVLSMISPVSVQ
jgi:hypothetical protein